MEAMRCVAMKKQFPIISFEHASFQYEGQSQESLKDVKLMLYIKQGMKTRGVGLSFWRIVSHPAQTYEGFLIPILMRLLMTATELSASAETRGISYPCEKTHYILVDFRLRDSILLIGMLALFAVVIWTSFQPISF